MKQKLISVIVPVYNAENYLERCLNSIVNQTYSNLEIILVDDGSRDRGPQICDSYAAGDKRIRVIHKQNGGLMSAWMAGVNVSAGDYLSFIDSDDWVETNMMEEMLKEAAGIPGEVICGNFVIEKDGHSTSHFMSYRRVYMKVLCWRIQLKEIYWEMSGVPYQCHGA